MTVQEQPAPHMLQVCFFWGLLHAAEKSRARLDVVNVDCTRNARDGVQLANIVLQVGHLMDEVAVAFEVHLHQQPELYSCQQCKRATYRYNPSLAALQNAASEDCLQSDRCC